MILRHEPDLEFYEQWAVESYVVDIFRRTLGQLSFHRRPGNDLDDITERIREMQLEDTPSDAPHTGAPSTPIRRRALDTMCTVTEGDTVRKLFAVEYKAADILTPFLLTLGLRDMDLEKIIYRNKTSTDEEVKNHERAELVVASIVTQVFDYMVDKGVSYGYATGGEAFIFFHFDPDHVQTLYYDWVAPGDEVSRQNDVSKSAIGLVASFTRLALDGPVLDADWSKEARRVLPVWNGDDDVRTDQITPSPVRPPKLSPAYRGKSKPSTDGSERSLRSKSGAGGKLAACDPTQDDEPKGRRRDDPNDDEDGPTMGTPPSGTQAQSRSKTTRSQQTKLQSNQGRSGSEKGKRRAFCTQGCLLGLVRGNPLDERCPNVEAHRYPGSHPQDQHGIDRAEFQVLLEEQLSQDHDDEGFESMDRNGWAGALFRITLVSHGYTFVGKGTVAPLIPVLRKEARIYDRLEEVQGKAVPVYLGSVDLPRIFWLTTTVAIEHVLLLSYGGEEAWRCGLEQKRFDYEMKRTVKEVQRWGVHQGDLRQPNLLWNEELGRIILIDFEYGKMGDKPEETRLSRRDRKKQKRALMEIDGNDRTAEESEKARKVEAIDGNHRRKWVNTDLDAVDQCEA